MPRPAVSLLALALGAVAALALVSCGGEDAQLLPGETAREITANLDAVQQLADEGDCVGAESATQQVSEQVESLQGVDGKLKRALEQGAERLNEVVDGCEEEEVEAISPAIVPDEDEATEADREKEEKGEEKEEKEAEKEREAAEKEEEREAGEEEGNPSLPPPAKGEGKGLDEGDDDEESSEGGGEEGPSGGVGPGAPAEEGD